MPRYVRHFRAEPKRASATLPPEGKIRTTRSSQAAAYSVAARQPGGVAGAGDVRAGPFRFDQRQRHRLGARQRQAGGLAIRRQRRGVGEGGQDRLDLRHQPLRRRSDPRGLRAQREVCVGDGAQVLRPRDSVALVATVSRGRNGARSPRARGCTARPAGQRHRRGRARARRRGSRGPPASPPKATLTHGDVQQPRRGRSSRAVKERAPSLDTWQARPPAPTSPPRRRKRRARRPRSPIPRMRSPGPGRRPQGKQQAPPRPAAGWPGRRNPPRPWPPRTVSTPSRWPRPPVHPRWPAPAPRPSASARAAEGQTAVGRFVEARAGGRDQPVAPPRPDD